ncbi:MAG: NAD-dependent epimerase/dehydratase family protein [Methylococcales bacterium]|nr:NAD-dependent epimerase/dehydratase family protein [Methylococcales bacterium]
MILVTGSTGFIGQRLVNCLKQSGAGIKVLSRHQQESYDTIVCDLQKESVPDNALSGIEKIYHLAGFAHNLRDANKIEHLYQAVNVDATVKLAELAVHSGVKQFVFVSSVKAGASTVVKSCIGEEQGDPEGIYGKTKREAELKLLEIGRQSDMHISIVRPALVYGPNVKGNLRLMLSGIKKGWFPPLPETGNIRSMIHVDDLVRVLLFVIDNDKTNGEIFIATDGKSYSAHDIYEAICCVVGKSIPKWSVPKQLFDIIAMMGSRMKYKIDKLFGDEHYSSAKLESLGFKAQKTLKDINETSF